MGALGRPLVLFLPLLWRNRNQKLGGSCCQPDSGSVPSQARAFVLERRLQSAGRAAGTAGQPHRGRETLSPFDLKQTFLPLKI